MTSYKQKKVIFIIPKFVLHFFCIRARPHSYMDLVKNSNILICTDNLRNNRDIGRSGHKICAALLCAFYQFYSVTRKILHFCPRRDTRKQTLFELYLHANMPAQITADAMKMTNVSSIQLSRTRPCSSVQNHVDIKL